jgi:hypothetical protein
VTCLSFVRAHPEAQASKLVDLMSKDIIADLQKSGHKAQRLAPGDAQPFTGAWVRGVFTEVDEGSRTRRAVIGFGSGQAKTDFLCESHRPEASRAAPLQRGAAGTAVLSQLAVSNYRAGPIAASGGMADYSISKVT